MNDNNFNDQIYIDQITKRLWCGKEYGHAAVMVGTGFSRNATPISPSSKPFPLWNDLTKIIKNELYGAIKIDNNNALQLAEEYVSAFGRESLNNMLIKNIPDIEYQPTEIFELLLTLPWSDVFTTNYDTLLERAAQKIYQRKYNVVFTHTDIPVRIKPRIIKLHGSFPSHFPLILTEEDYRTYPKKMAPFVNLVQQSLMENIFCLIGFSGDDPNFLYWSGWVRDYFGENTPKIYLCGLLNLSNSKRQYFLNRNIIPIDLTPLFPKSKFPEITIRQKFAIEWFLLNLFYGAPPNPLQWPYFKKNVFLAIQNEDKLPPIHRQEYKIGQESLIPSLSQDKLKEELTNLLFTWSLIRKSYPNWIIMPKELRYQIWQITEQWIELIIENLSMLDQPNDLLIIYELLWRLDKVFFPLVDTWVERIEKVLLKYIPFPELLESLQIGKIKTQDVKDIQHIWIEIVFSIIRTSREDQNIKKLNYWVGIIEKIANPNPKWSMRLYYEKLMNSLFHLDYEQVRNYLKGWPQYIYEPYWEIKRAALLAEIGEISEAEKICVIALTRIRENVKDFDNDFYWVSLESWAMILTKIIKQSVSPYQDKFVQEFNDRWEKLNSYKCNPWSELEFLSANVKLPMKISPKGKQIKKSFDPDISTVSLSFYSNLNIFDFINEFSLLRLFEDAAIPFRCGYIVINNEEIKEAAIKIYPFSPFTTIISLIRIQNKEGIEKIFTRVSIAQTSQEDIDRVWSIFYSNLEKQLKHYSGIYKSDDKGHEQNFVKNSISVSCEILSRISFRLGLEERSKLLKVTIYLYNTYPDDFYEQINYLFMRLLYAVQQDDLPSIIASLIQLPIPTVNAFFIDMLGVIRDPFGYIEIKNMHTIPSIIGISEKINELINIAKNNLHIARERAITRIAKLYNLHLLDNNQIQEFGEALWKSVDSENGLPIDTPFYFFAFINLPSPEEIDPKLKIKEYLLKNNFEPLFNISPAKDGKISKLFSPGTKDVYAYNLLNSTRPLFEDGNIFLDWTIDEINLIAQKVITYWDTWKDDIINVINEKSYYNEQDHIIERIRQMMEIIGHVIFHYYKSDKTYLLNKLINITETFEEKGIGLTRNLPFYLIQKPEMENHVASIIRKDMNSISLNKIRDAIVGLFYWLVLYSQEKIKEPPKDILNELINRIVTRRQPGLDVAIKQTAIIFWRIPSIIKEQHISDISIGLEYLLTETKYETDINSSSETLSDFFTLEEIPHYRALCSELSKRIYDYLTERDFIIPATIDKWKTEAINDRLPEVKKIWLENTSNPSQIK